MKHDKAPWNLRQEGGARQFEIEKSWSADAVKTINVMPTLDHRISLLGEALREGRRLVRQQSCLQPALPSCYEEGCADPNWAD